jgi:glycosyltransferase 2 family protein
VPEGTSRRRPVDGLELVSAAVIVATTALFASDVSAFEKWLYEWLVGLPREIQWVFDFGYRVLLPAALLVVLGASLYARRWRFAGTVLTAAIVSAAAGYLLDRSLAETVVDAMVEAGVEPAPSGLDHPPVLLAGLMGGLLASLPYLTRPVRHLMHLVVLFAAFSAVALAEATPVGVVCGLAAAWGVAAATQLAFGTPAGTPSLGEVAQALTALGVAHDDLQPDGEHLVGESRFSARSGEGRIDVTVIGRDAADAHLLAKLARFVWYKDSGSRPRLSRAGQVEHRAYLTLLAAHAGAAVPDVIAAGTAGDLRHAVLVTAHPAGRPLAELAPDDLSDDVLDDTWLNLERFHSAGLAHGNVHAGNVVSAADGTTWLIDLSRATTSATASQMQRDAAALLIATASIVGVERAVEGAARSLGSDGLRAVLPVIQVGVLPRTTRRSIPVVKSLVAALREGAAGYLGTDVPPVVELQRVSSGNLLMAAGAILGVYLLLGELSSVRSMGDVFSAPIWGWVAVTFVVSQTPQLAAAGAMLGSVAAPLPLGPVIGVQFANNFTGFVGGTVATLALVVRFFQKQGLGGAVAISSGVLNTMATMITQTILVVIGLVATASAFDLSGRSASEGGEGSANGAALVIIGFCVLVAVVLLVPRLRRQILDKVKPQVSLARENLRAISGTPHKLVQLLVGNALAQILFALTLEAALLAYGYSLPILELVVINSFASILGGIMPVPGGLGVIEAGLIAGFSAAGVPQDVAVSATFTARTFTAYLPPVWGWFSLRWLQTHDYV